MGTHPDFRRRGVRGTLVFEAARHALARLGAGTLVMAADEDDSAAKSYESVGSSPTERQVGMAGGPAPRKTRLSRRLVGAGRAPVPVVAAPCRTPAAAAEKTAAACLENPA